MRQLSVGVVVTLLLVAAGCSDDPSLAVALRTDLIAGIEFTQTRTTLARGGVPTAESGWTNTQVMSATSGDFVTGRRVAEYGKVANGTFAVRVELLDAIGGRVAQGRVLVQISGGQQAVTVVVTRDCRGVSCPGASDDPTATACLGGRCVDPRCSPETPEFCPMAECDVDTDCTVSSICAIGRCVSGSCFLAERPGACSSSEYCDPDRGCVPRPVDAGVDGGMRDAGSGPCATVTCGSFEYCEDGACLPYAGCITVDECAAGDVCLHRHCIPTTHDVDGDGATAATDCDETSAAIHPGAEERCNAIDDNCNREIDEGDPGLLCVGDPSRGICIDGVCGCPAGTYDFDREPSNGCECVATPSGSMGASCDTAIDLGEVRDTGQMVAVSGNVLPDDREIWYRFRAFDTADTTCDNFHVRALFTSNPDNRFEMTVLRGDCGTLACGDMGYDDFRWATDFRDAAGTGECPCAPEPGAPGLNFCNDNTADFFLRVRRRPGSLVDCTGYVLEISNGLYDS